MGIYKQKTPEMLEEDRKAKTREMYYLGYDPQATLEKIGKEVLTVFYNAPDDHEPKCEEEIANSKTEFQKRSGKDADTIRICGELRNRMGLTDVVNIMGLKIVGRTCGCLMYHTYDLERSGDKKDEDG